LDPMEEQKKKNEPISIERGKEIDEELKGPKWNNLSMRVHLFNEKYIEFLRHFESPEAYKRWYDLFIQKPWLEGCPGIVSWRALMLALDKLEPDLAEAESQRVQLELLNQKLRQLELQEESQRVQLELLNQKLRQLELQKKVLRGQAVAQYSEMTEVLKLPNTMNEMLNKKEDAILQQMRMGRLDMEESLETVITKAMMEGRDRLKDMVINRKVTTCPETKKLLCMYV
jgi:hypothetical protein